MTTDDYILGELLAQRILNDWRSIRSHEFTRNAPDFHGWRARDYLAADIKHNEEYREMREYLEWLLARARVPLPHRQCSGDA
jgi:hypothetical protein